MKKPALATNYRDCSLGRELCAAPMQRRGSPRSLPSRRKRATPCSTLLSTESRWTTSRESSSCLPSTTTTRTRSRRSTTRTSGNPPPCSPGRPVWRLPIGTSQPAPHCACAPRDPVCTHSQLQLQNEFKSVVCQLGEQHHPATSAVTKKLVDGRRPVSDLPAPPGDSHTSDSIVSSPPREPPRPWTLEQV